MGETININGKTVGVIIVLLLLLISTFGMIFLNLSNDRDSAISNNDGDGMPEKCKLPAGQDVNSWKEHLGHHAETQDCLKYFK